LSPLGTSATVCSIYQPRTMDDGCGAVGGITDKGNKSNRRNLPQCHFFHHIFHRLCGLVIRVLGYRSGGPKFDSRHNQKKKVVGLERGPLCLVCTTEELLDRKVAALVGRRDPSRHADHVASFIRKSWRLLRRQAAVARLV
jgi:hypothetical protein